MTKKVEMGQCLSDHTCTCLSSVSSREGLGRILRTLLKYILHQAKWKFQELEKGRALEFSVQENQINLTPLAVCD